MLPSLVFCIAAVIGVALYTALLSFLYANSDVKQLTVWQYSVAVAYGIVVAIWAGAEAGFAAARMQPRYDAVAEDEQDLVNESDNETGSKQNEDRQPPAAAEKREAQIFMFKAAQLPILRLCAEFVGIMVCTLRHSLSLF